MQFQKVLVPLACLAVMGAAYRAYGWAGVAGATGAIVMWLLMHFTRMIKVLERAAASPVGYIDSAVMLNARLRRGTPLVRLLARTRSLGAAQSPEGVQPEVFRWTDESQSFVDCVFVDGRLTSWTLTRPESAP